MAPENTYTSYSYSTTALACQNNKIITRLCQAKLRLVKQTKLGFQFYPKEDVTMEYAFNAVLLFLGYIAPIFDCTRPIEILVLSFFEDRLSLSQPTRNICSENCKQLRRKKKSIAPRSKLRLRTLPSLESGFHIE